MSSEDFNYLSKYEYIFEQIRDGYAQAISTIVLEKFRTIYENTTKSRLAVNLSCTRCKMDLLERLSGIYYKEKEKLNNTNGDGIGVRYQQDREKEEKEKPILKNTKSKKKKA